MTQYIVRRLLATIPVILIVTFIVFVLMFLAPGDPIFLLADVEQTQGMTEEQLDVLRHELGLDRPLIVQYGDWLFDALRGDLGTSIRGGRQVVDMLKSAFTVSMELTLLAMAFALIIAIPVGVYAALRPNSLGDLFGTTLAIGGISAPNFWVALLLIYFFAVKLGWLPSNGFTRFSEDAGENLRKMVLPVITLGIALMASVMRMTRSGMLEVMHQDYIRTARAKGAKERRVIFAHAFRNAMLPVLTIIGLQFGALWAVPSSSSRFFHYRAWGGWDWTPFSSAISRWFRAWYWLSRLAICLLICWSICSTASWTRAFAFHNCRTYAFAFTRLQKSRG